MNSMNSMNTMNTMNSTMTCPTGAALAAAVSAHGSDPRPRKTKLCDYFAAGGCWKGTACRRAHGEAELVPRAPRAKVVPASPAAVRARASPAPRAESPPRDLPAPPPAPPTLPEPDLERLPGPGTLRRSTAVAPTGSSSGCPEALLGRAPDPWSAVLLVALGSVAAWAWAVAEALVALVRPSLAEPEPWVEPPQLAPKPKTEPKPKPARKTEPVPAPVPAPAPAPVPAPVPAPQPAPAPPHVPWQWRRPSDFVRAPAPAFEAEVRRHVVVDWSNISLAAQHRPDGSKDRKILVDPDKLAALLELGSSPLGQASPVAKPGLRAAAGSKYAGITWTPQGLRQLEKRGFDVLVEELGHMAGEAEVDSWLHRKALDLVRAVAPTASPGADTLVLATGDGNGHDGVTNFPMVVFEAARAGFRVEVWAWQHSFNFKLVRGCFPKGQVKLCKLEDHRERVTFLKAAKGKAAAGAAVAAPALVAPALVAPALVAPALVAPALVAPALVAPEVAPAAAPWFGRLAGWGLAVCAAAAAVAWSPRWVLAVAAALAWRWLGRPTLGATPAVPSAAVCRASPRAGTAVALPTGVAGAC